MKKRMPLRTCQRRLVAVWLAGCAPAFLLLFVQSISGVYGEFVEQAWGWFLPTIVPTLSVIVGGVAYQARRTPSKANVDGTAFSVSLILSIAYLALVLATLLLRPLSTATPLQFLATSNLWLVPIQGLAGLSIGAFFTSSSDRT
jgi:hypothetical protein